MHDSHRDSLRDSFFFTRAVILPMPIWSAIMRTLNRRSEFSISRTGCTLSLVFDADGRPVRGSSFKPSRPSLKSLCHLQTAVCDTLSSLNIWRIIPNVSVPGFPSPTQNLMVQSFAAFWACTESLDRGSLKTRSSLNKRSQMTDAWRVLKVRRKKLFPIFFIQTLYIDQGYLVFNLAEFDWSVQIF